MGPLPDIARVAPCNAAVARNFVHLDKSRDDLGGVEPRHNVIMAQTMGSKAGTAGIPAGINVGTIGGLLIISHSNFING